MFVVCPSCAGPFRIPADQIAPLVQIACPHCAFHMILDFEAANDPSLVESGHLMAQGFETAEQYFSVYNHIGPQTDLKPRRVEAPAAAEPKAPPTTPPVQSRPVQVAKTPTGPQPVLKTPSAPQPVAEAPAPVAPVAAAPEPAPTTAAPKQVGNKTIIRTPDKPKALEPNRPDAIAPAGPTARAGRQSDMVTEPATPAVDEAAAERRPPHTPPAATAVSNAPSTPEPAATTKPEDIAAQSGSHPSKPNPAASAEAKSEPKPATTEPTKPAAEGEKKPPVPTNDGGGSNTVMIVIVVVILIVIAVVVMMNRG